MGAREMAQGLRIYTAQSEGTCSVPSTYSGQLTTSCNSSTRGSSTLFWTPWAPTLPCAHISTIHTHTHTHN